MIRRGHRQVRIGRQEFIRGIAGGDHGSFRRGDGVVGVLVSKEKDGSAFPVSFLGRPRSQRLSVRAGRKEKGSHENRLWQRHLAKGVCAKREMGGVSTSDCSVQVQQGGCCWLVGWLEREEMGLASVCLG